MSLWQFPGPWLPVHPSLWSASPTGSILAVYSRHGIIEIPSSSTWNANSWCDKTILAFWSFRRQWSGRNISTHFSLPFRFFSHPCLPLYVLPTGSQKWAVARYLSETWEYWRAFLCPSWYGGLQSRTGLGVSESWAMEGGRGGETKSGCSRLCVYPWWGMVVELWRYSLL